MNERLRKARRILAVQFQLDRLAAWNLVDLEVQAAALGDRHRDLIRFMDGESAFTGLFAAAMMRRLQALAEAQSAIASKIETQRVQFREERGRLRCAERIVAASEHEARKTVEANRLTEAIEAALTHGSSASRKLGESN